MVKLLGAVLIFAGCGGFGFTMAAYCRREDQILEQLSRALEYMSCELSYRLTPLPQLCRNTANAVTGPIRYVFENLAEELDRQVAPDAYLCMESVLESGQPLPESTARLLKQLGQTLGQFDLPGQLRGIEGCALEVKMERERLAQNRENRLRSYQTLGLCAGAALAILFL